VICLGCGDTQPRTALQPRLRELNPDWRPHAAAAAPDGDADIDTDAVARFEPPHCAHCGGLLKPDVVFFGENVPRARYAQALDALHASDGVLAVGTSLMVYSGFRFVRMAHERGIHVALLNRGRTRADDLGGLKLDADCGAVLDALAS
jgi:NAD-dependent SIR2 family protein deacetylase